MESTSNEISLNNIGIFINALEKDLKENFYNEGINCIIRVSISQILEINISCIDMISEEPREYEYNSDIEREELILNSNINRDNRILFIHTDSCYGGNFIENVQDNYYNLEKNH